MECCLPLLTPLSSLSTVHSSIGPNWTNIALISSSVSFLHTIPINNFRSAEKKVKQNICVRNLFKFIFVAWTNFYDILCRFSHIVKIPYNICQKIIKDIYILFMMKGKININKNGNKKGNKVLTHHFYFLYPLASSVLGDASKNGQMF